MFSNEVPEPKILKSGVSHDFPALVCDMCNAYPHWEMTSTGGYQIMAKPFYQTYDVPEEVMEEALNILELTASTGKIRKGTNEVTKALERGIAKLVYIAKDVDPPEIVAHLPLLSREKEVPHVYVPTKQGLGQACGLEVPSASVVIVEGGEADEPLKALIQKLIELVKSS